MASTTIKKTCAKCNKGGGTAMCYGCEQAFCTKHFIEHRQDLSQQMDNIGQEHDILRKDLTTEQGSHPLLKRINEWEQESITKIQTAAEIARADLHQLLKKAKTNLKTSVSKLTEELQSSRESDDYTEIEIKKWSNRLQKLRQMLDSPTTINIEYENDNQSTIRLLKVNEYALSAPVYQASEQYGVNNRFSSNLDTFANEKFVDVYGRITLYEEGHVATCDVDTLDDSCVSGSGRYSSGVHHIRLQIEEMDKDYYLFFGIITALEKLTNDVLKSTSCYGWLDLNYNIVGGKMQKSDAPEIEIGDEITLTLKCDDRRIQLSHHRTKKIIEMSIDPRLCPFPWKFIVVLPGKNDCVRILR